jgi:hypothetical protein
MMSHPSDPIGILPHSQFVDSIARADFDGMMTDAHARVADPNAFKEMQMYLLRTHEGLDIAHSFADDAGQTFDCVPINQQPSLKGTGRAPATPPDLSALSGARSGVGAAPSVSGPLHADRKDRHGNVMACPPGTIPMRRVTLDQLARFRTLTDYHSKKPRSYRPASRPPGLVPGRGGAPVTPGEGHLYAAAQQAVAAIGGHSFLSLDAPAVNSDEVFSLSQQWYTGGSQASLQTAEVGWQVFPTHYPTDQPVLFVYWTNNGYNFNQDPSGSQGVYNLESPGYVQTNAAWPLGGALSPVSAAGGEQYEIEVLVYLYQGNWWLYLGGTSASNAIGYWPTSIYNGGQMASNADTITFGGETCSTTGSYAPMGSGAFASSGWTQAAYHRDIYYFPTDSSAQWPQLGIIQNTPNLYTIGLSSAADPWNIYFFYGGPGGSH